MSIQEVSPEKLAELFHHYHQALGPDFGCDTKAILEEWQQMPQQERADRCCASGIIGIDFNRQCTGEVKTQFRQAR